MFWLAVVINFLLVMSVFIVERLVKRKFNLPKKLKYTKRFTKTQTLIEVVIAIVFIIGSFMASTSVYESGIYRPLNPIPLYLWISLYMLVLNGFRGYMVKKFARDSMEYYVYFAFAGWAPIIIIIAYHTTKFLLIR